MRNLTECEMTIWGKPPIEPGAGPVVAPSVCPTCRGRSISTTSKVATIESYWRCADCGEVWNDARRGEVRGKPANRWR